MALPAPFSLLLALVLLASCSKPAPTTGPLPAETVAVVNGVPVDFQELRVTAAKNGYDLFAKDGAGKALRDAVNFELLAAEAEKRGFFQHPEVRRLARGLAVKQLLAERIDGEIGNTVLKDKELRDFYEARKASEFTQPTLVRGRVLFLVRREGAPGAEALSAKRKLVEEALAANTKPFADLVREHSDNPAARTNGGDTNWLTMREENRRYPKELVAALAGAKDSTTVLGPVESPQGIYWAQLTERRDGKTIPFEDAKPSLSERVFRERRLEAYDQYLQKLRRNYPVEEFPETLAGALQAASGKESAPSSGPPLGPVRVAPAAAPAAQPQAKEQ